MEAFTIIYTVLGGLGIFFYGMKNMSDALQVVAGDIIKKVIHSLTTNRMMAVVVGTLVTMLVQSSSVTTVMVVGFVNAGLMNLTQAIGVIFGANIGTTITGWIISIKIGKYGLLLIGLGIFPMLFSSKQKLRQIGRVCFGVGMIFFGLQIMSGAFKPLRSMQGFLDVISFFSGEHYTAYLASVFMGCVLTMVVQSSSAMLGITIALALSGVIKFHTAAALVMGENIGTTITALLASVGGNVSAKRAARAHAIFNLLGVIILFSIFPFYVNFVDWLVPGEVNFIDSSGDRPYIAVHIASAHTIFNVTATIVFLPFLKVLANIVTKITPDKGQKEQHHLVMLGNPLDMPPTAALLQVSIENEKMQDIVKRMFVSVETFITSEDKNTELLVKIKDYEHITDNIQKEITLFVGKLLEHRLTTSHSAEALLQIKIADELESIADYLDKIVTYDQRLSENKFKGDSKVDILNFFKKVEAYFLSIGYAIADNSIHDRSKDERTSEELHHLANDLRDKHFDRVKNGEYKPISALMFSDMIMALRKIRGHVFNISQAIERTKLS